MLQPFAILHPLLSRSESSDRIGTSTYRKMYKDNSQIAACHTRWGSRSNRSEGCDEKLRTSPMESFPSYSESVQFGIFWCFCFCICVAVLQSSFIGPKTFQTQPRDTTPALRHMRCRRADKLVGSSQQKLGGLALKLLQVSKNVAKGGTSYLHNFAYDIWHHLRFHQISLEFLSCLIHFDPFPRSWVWSLRKVRRCWSLCLDHGTSPTRLCGAFFPHLSIPFSNCSTIFGTILERQHFPPFHISGSWRSWACQLLRDGYRWKRTVANLKQSSQVLVSA